MRQNASSDVFTYIEVFYNGGSGQRTGFIGPAETAKSGANVRGTSYSRPSCVPRSSEPETA
jgi:hypothetical protein